MSSYLLLLLNGHLHFLMELVDIFLKIIFGSPQVQVLLKALCLVSNNLRKSSRILDIFENLQQISHLVLQLSCHPGVLIGESVQVLRKLFPHLV